MSSKLSNQEIQHVEERLSHAAFEPNDWTSNLERIAALLGGNGAALFSLSNVKGATFGAAAGIGCEALPEYESVWAPEDPWLRFAKPHHFSMAGVAELGSSILSSRDLRSTLFYADFARRHDLENLISLRVCDSQDPFAPVTHLSVFRPRGKADFSRPEVRALQRIWPALRRAIHGHWLLQRASSAERIASDAFDAIHQPVWVLRADGFIDYANGAAGAALRECRSSFVCVSGRLVSIGSTPVNRLLVSSAGPDERSRGTVGIEMDGRIRIAQLFLTRLIGNHHLWNVWPQAEWVLMLGSPSKDLAASSQDWLHILQRWYCLTPAELRVLSLLKDGFDAQEIAHRLKVKLPTVRTHLAALFLKTGTKRQTELVRIVLGG